VKKEVQHCTRTYICCRFTKFPSSDGKEPEKLFDENDLQI